MKQYILSFKENMMYQNYNEGFVKISTKSKPNMLRSHQISTKSDQRKAHSSGKMMICDGKNQLDRLELDFYTMTCQLTCQSQFQWVRTYHELPQVSDELMLCSNWVGQEGWVGSTGCLDSPTRYNQQIIKGFSLLSVLF